MPLASLAGDLGSLILRVVLRRPPPPDAGEILRGRRIYRADQRIGRSAIVT
jgi:hypothetical protein